MIFNWLFPGSIHEVAYRQDGMSAKHSRPRITHYGSDLVSHGRLEAMNRTLGASRLSLLEGTFVKTFSGIGEQFAALPARRVGFMVTAAVEFNHDANGLGFSSYPRTVALLHCDYIAVGELSF